MKIKTQRINVQFSKEKYKLIEQIAKIKNVSLSEKVRQLIESALENAEDMDLMMVAEKRLSKYSKKNGDTPIGVGDTPGVSPQCVLTREPLYIQNITIKNKMVNDMLRERDMIGWICLGGSCLGLTGLTGCLLILAILP